MQTCPPTEEKVFRLQCPGTTLFSFSLYWEQHSSSTRGFAKPFTVISRLTQHPFGAHPPFSGSREINCCLRSLRAEAHPSPLPRQLKRYIYGKIILEMETESLLQLDLSLNWTFYTYLLSLIIK